MGNLGIGNCLKITKENLFDKLFVRLLCSFEILHRVLSRVAVGMGILFLWEFCEIGNGNSLPMETPVLSRIKHDSASHITYNT